MSTGFLKFFYHALSGVGLTALRAEGYGRLSAAGCVPTGETTHYILCVAPLLQNVFAVHRFAQGAGRKVLRIDRPAAGGFLSLTAFQAEGCGIALRAMSINSALRIHLSVSYGMIGILLTGSLRSPPPIRLRRTSPRESVSHDSQVALLPYESCSLATPVQGAE